MATSNNCPQCGTPLEFGAVSCTACGYQLSAPAEGAAPEPEQQPPAWEQPEQPPIPAGPAHQDIGAAPVRPSAAGGATQSATAMLNETLERWGVQQSGVLIAAAALFAVAFLVGTLANISYLTAGDGDQLQKFDAQVWFTLALGAAIGALVLLLLVRWQSGPTAETAERDLQVGVAIGALALLFCLLGLFKGFDDSFDAQDSWLRYALIYAFLAAGWLAISRPIPAAVGTVGSAMAAIVAVGVAGAVLVIGQFMGLSEDYSRYVSGVSLQSVGIVVMVLAVAWVLGLQPRSRV